jgi:hypothetical protein
VAIEQRVSRIEEEVRQRHAEVTGIFVRPQSASKSEAVRAAAG